MSKDFSEMCEQLGAEEARQILLNLKTRVTDTRKVENRENANDDDLRPRVRVPGKGTSMRQCAEQLYKALANQRSIFLWNNTVVKLTTGNDGHSREIELLTPASARLEFENHVTFVKFVKGADEVMPLSEQDAKTLLTSDLRKQLPKLKGILESPIPLLDAQGFHILPAGYDERSGFHVTGGALVEPATVEEAVASVETLLEDFSFQSDSDYSRALSMLLTPALKLGGFIKGHVPIDVVEAEESQTGKGFLVNIRSLLYGQRSLILAQQRSGVGSLDERLASVLLKGKTFIVIDNVRGRLDSQNLESFLTATGPFCVRVPYSGEKAIQGDVFLFSITSNGVEMTEDLTNRASFISLRKKPERVFKLYKGLPVDEHLILNQSHYLGAITKVIRHWHSQDMPKSAENRHSFREWASIVDWIIVNIFKRAPLLDGNRETQKRVQNPALSFVRKLACQIDRLAQLNTQFKAQDLANLCESCGIEIPGVQAQPNKIATKIEGQRIGQLMLQAFSEENVLVLDAYTVTRGVEKSHSSDGHAFDSKIYFFRKTTQAKT